jgi:large subunit ribosomal protein L5
MNPMKSVRIEKVTLNIGTGKPGPELEKAKKLLNMITGRTVIETKTNKRIPGWGLRPGLSIGCKVTLRGEEAKELLGRLLKAVENKLGPRSFDNNGNVSFGIAEYIDIPGVKYNMEIGIIGLSAAVTLSRPGFRIKARRIKGKSIPKRHRVSRDDAIAFIRETYQTKIGGE